MSERLVASVVMVSVLFGCIGWLMVTIWLYHKVESADNWWKIGLYALWIFCSLVVLVYLVLGDRI